MTYFDLLDPDESQSALLSARQSFLDARHLLQAGSIRTGMFALYDSLLFAMYQYVLRHENNLTIDLCDGTGLFHRLVVAGLFEDSSAFDRLSWTIERALWQSPHTFDPKEILEEVETMHSKLGVLPFQESALHPEAWVSSHRESRLNTY